MIAHDDAVEVAPQVWGNQWQYGLGLLTANVRAAGALPGTRGWVEPAWLDHRLTVRRGEVLIAVDDVPAQRSVTLRVLFPPSALTPGAPYARHVHDDILPATIAREQAAAARAERDKPPARGHPPPSLGVDPRGLPAGDRAGRPPRRHRLLALRSRAPHR